MYDGFIVARGVTHSKMSGTADTAVSVRRVTPLTVSQNRDTVILSCTANHASKARAKDRIAAMKFRDLVKTLKADGWYEVRSNGSHHIFAHPTKPGSFPVPYHSLGADVPKGTEQAILKQAGLK